MYAARLEKHDDTNIFTRTRTLPHTHMQTHTSRHTYANTHTHVFSHTHMKDIDAAKIQTELVSKIEISA